MRKYLSANQNEFKPQPPALKLGSLPGWASTSRLYHGLTWPTPWAGGNTHTALYLHCHELSPRRLTSNILFFIFSLSFSLLFGFLSSSSLSLSPCILPPPHQARNQNCPQNPFPTLREGSQSTVRVGRPLARPAPLPASWGVPEGWAQGGAKVSEGGGWAGGALHCGGGQTGWVRWLQGSEVGARVGSGGLEWGCIQGGGCSPVTLLGTGTREHGPGAHGLWQV